MDKEKIYDLALASGFKAKEQPDGNMDLNPYVYDFAHALLTIAKHESDKRVIDAVSGSRKAWAAQGCPEVKALHGAKAIRDAVYKLRQSMTEDGSKWLCRVDDLLAYAEELEKTNESD